MNPFCICIFLAVALNLTGCVRPLQIEVPAGEKPVGMVWIPGGKFAMGGPGMDACQDALSATDPKKPTV